MYQEYWNKVQECKKYCARKLVGGTKQLDGRTKKLDGAILISIVIIIMIVVMNEKMDGMNIISIVRIENIDYSFKLLIKLEYMVN